MEDDVCETSHVDLSHAGSRPNLWRPTYRRKLMAHCALVVIAGLALTLLAAWSFPLRISVTEWNFVTTLFVVVSFTPWILFVLAFFIERDGGRNGDLSRYSLIVLCAVMCLVSLNFLATGSGSWGFDRLFAMVVITGGANFWGVIVLTRAWTSKTVQSNR